MNYLDIVTTRIYFRPSCIASLASIYGIGKVRAKRLNCFLLNQPNQKEFRKHLRAILFTEVGRNVFGRTFIDKKLRLFIALKLKQKIRIFCYQAYRLFQGLPTKGQNTKANGGTPSRLNHYLALKINLKFYNKNVIRYKRKELLNNGRFEELKSYNESLLEDAKKVKESRKQKAKKAREIAIRALKAAGKKIKNKSCLSSKKNTYIFYKINH